MIDVSDSPYGHKMSVYVLLKADKLGVSLYLGKTHPAWLISRGVRAADHSALFVFKN
jgi:hypothetical protein